MVRSWVEGAAFGSVRVQPGVEVGAGVVVEGAGGGHVPDRDEHGVLDSDDRLHRSTAWRDASVLDSQVGVLGPSRRHRRGTEGALGVGVAGSGLGPVSYTHLT